MMPNSELVSGLSQAPFRQPIPLKQPSIIEISK
jgi:hypothetical protein